MGVIIKYQLDFSDVDLKVSNDVFAGDFILDADITAQMARGSAGSTFELKIYDLPNQKAKALHQQVKTSHSGKVAIKLGYMDDPGGFSKVMDGIFTKVSAAVDGDKLVTTIKGMETATHALTRTSFLNNLNGASTVQDAVRATLSNAKFTEGEVDTSPKLNNITDSLQDAVLRGDHLIDVLDSLAQIAHAELVVVDKQVSIGKPIENDDYSPKPFSRDVNLAFFTPFTQEIPEESDVNVLEPVKPNDAIGFHFKIAGDPKLRPGQKVSTNFRGFDNDSGVFRAHTVIHNFSSTNGYICEGVALKICTDDRCRRQEEAITFPSADGVIQKLSQHIQQKQKQRPSVEIGAVKEYKTGSSSDAKHSANLYYGQKFKTSETQPSIRVEVEQKDDQLLRNKPISSPFAWRKCGLVTPVYPGMKAVLAHNLDLPNDAVISGFIWSDTPSFPPPENKTGDWWLCLPTDVDGSSPPSDSTKAVNDLTANNGKRVVEVKGLKITVGASKLGNVGARPSEGGDDEFLIEHSGGTKLTISSDGKLSIEASSIAIKGDVTIEGTLEIK